jgi:hypothetical protein
VGIRRRRAEVRGAAEVEMFFHAGGLTCHWLLELKG